MLETTEHYSYKSVYGQSDAMLEVIGKHYSHETLYGQLNTVFINCTFDNCIISERLGKKTKLIFRNCSVSSSRILVDSIEATFNTKFNYCNLDSKYLTLNTSLCYRCKLNFKIEKITLSNSCGIFTNFNYLPSVVDICPNSYCNTLNHFVFYVDNNLVVVKNSCRSFAFDNIYYKLSQIKKRMASNKISESELVLIKKIYSFLKKYHDNKK